MSIDLLFELQQETRRLFVAGSAMAAGDPRLFRHLPGLRRLGETAPVFKRIADALEALQDAKREESAERLLELGTLLGAVLYTQGKTGADGEGVPAVGAGISVGTDISYRKLHPFIEALTTKGQGRLEQIRTSFEDGSYRDLRALPAVCAALDDGYAEIPEFLQEKLIPAFGRDAVPVLRSQLNLQGGKGDGRRLQLLHRQLGAEAAELAAEAASGGSPEVKLAAVPLLGGYPDREPLLQELAADKRKEVREAAYFALARLGTPTALERLYEAIGSKDRELAVEPIRESGSAPLLQRAIGLGEAALDAYAAGEGEGAARNEAAERIRIAVSCLRGAGRETADATYAFVRRLLACQPFLVAETENTQEAAAELLLQLELPEADRYAIELGDLRPDAFVGYGFRAAFRTMRPAELYERYAAVLNSAKSRAAKELLGAIRGQARDGLPAGHTEAVDPSAWDARWVRLFVKLDQQDLVCMFASDSDREVKEYLLAKLQKTKSYDWSVYDIFYTMFRIGVKEAPEQFMAMLEQKSMRSFYSLSWKQKHIFAAMPKSYAPRLRAFAEQLSYEYVRAELLAIIEQSERQPDDRQEEQGRGLWGWIKNKMS